MKTDAGRALLTVAREVLEAFSFMFADTEGEATAETMKKSELLEAKMCFSGKKGGGSLFVAAPAPLCLSIAANVLGEPLKKSGMAGDALKELANIVCGRITVAIFGEKPSFRMGVPLCRKITRSQWAKLEQGRDCARLWVEGYPMLFRVAMSRARK